MLDTYKRVQPGAAEEEDEGESLKTIVSYAASAGLWRKQGKYIAQKLYVTAVCP